MDPYIVIQNPLATEKAVRMMETENKLLLNVEFKATKADIKAAVEKLFKAKVETVNTLINGHAQKRAIVKLSPETSASEIMAQLGLM